MPVKETPKVIVTSTIKENVGKRVSQEFLEAFNDEMWHLLKKAEQRCTANSRETLLAQDI